MTDFKPNVTKSIDNIVDLEVNTKDLETKTKDLENRVEELEQSGGGGGDMNLQNIIMWDLTNIEPSIVHSIYAGFDKYVYEYNETVSLNELPSNEIARLASYMKMIMDLANSLKYNDEAEFTPLPLILYMKDGNKIYNLYINSWSITSSETEYYISTDFTTNELMMLNYQENDCIGQCRLNFIQTKNYTNQEIQYYCEVEIYKKKSN